MLEEFLKTVSSITKFVIYYRKIRGTIENQMRMMIILIVISPNSSNRVFKFSNH